MKTPKQYQRPDAPDDSADDRHVPTSRQPDTTSPSRHNELTITLWVFACLLAVWLLYSWMFERMFSN
jgi:hypothetical protein